LKYLYFAGCVTPQRENGFELSARNVFEKLGIELVEFEGASCCGYFLESVDFIASSVLAARNLSLAEEKNLDVLTLFPTCSGHLKKTKEKILKSEDLRKKMNSALQSINRIYRGTSEPKHFTKVLIEDVGIEKIKESVTKPLNGLRIAPHYGCHLLRPSDELSFDDPEDPKLLDSLIEATGAKCVDYTEKRTCCGAPLIGIDEDLALKILDVKLRSISDVEVDAIVTVCPFCHLQFDLNQSRIELPEIGTPRIPVLHYTQLLGLAQGLTEDELALYENRTPVDSVLQKINKK